MKMVAKDMQAETAVIPPLDVTSSNSATATMPIMEKMPEERVAEEIDQKHASNDPHSKPTPFQRKISSRLLESVEELTISTSFNINWQPMSSSAPSNSRFRQEIIDTLRTLAEDPHDFELSEKLMIVSDVNENGQPIVQESTQQTADTPLGDTLLQKASDIFAQRWKLKDEMSEVSFKGMLLVLEQCLGSELKNHASFAHFIDLLAYHTVFFWKKAVPFLYESDLRYGTNYRDALLFSLTLYDVNTGKNRLRELFAAVPGLRDSLLAKPAKRFEEAFTTMMQRRQSGSGSALSPAAAAAARNAAIAARNAATAALRRTNDQSNIVLDQVRARLAEVDTPTIDGHNNNETTDDEVAKVMASAGDKDKELHRQNSNSSGVSTGTGGANENGLVIGTEHDGTHEGKSSGQGSSACLSPPPITLDPPDSVFSSGLSSGHFQERVIAISNAPPVSLRKRADSGNWEIGQGSGGLVSCCAPVMNKDPENLWLACFGPDVPLKRGTRCESPSMNPPTNSLGIPFTRTASAEVQFSMLQDPNREEDGVRQEIKDTIGLLNVLKNYNKDNYKLNPVVVAEEDYNTYYGGISNGVLWPALHNLPEYIVKEYDDEAVLREHWNAYVRVNYQFAINAARNSRQQDFLWIHDYHLMLTGAMLQSLDPNLEVGFFLHIPFQPPEVFFTKYKVVGEAVLRGMLAFNKVGFQTHRDRTTFIELVTEHLPQTKIEYDQASDKHMTTYEGMSASLGVFPVSIKNEEFLEIVRKPESVSMAEEIRKKFMGERTGKFFFSVERFDYTKGIKEKLVAYKRYYERHPDRIGKDVFFQVAVINRRSVDTYRVYQDECVDLANAINEEFKCAEDPEWKPLIFQTSGLTRAELIPHYMAMDVGVVTPKKDGMNLVAKEMLICNPSATLILSSGAGTEQQFEAAGFYTEQDKLYHRVTDVYDADSYADSFYEAAIEDRSVIAAKSKRLSDFLMENDIEKWSKAFLDPSWTSDVIKMSHLRTLRDFYSLMHETRRVRRQIVERVLKGTPLRPQFALSLRNARMALKENCREGGNVLWLRTTTTDADESSSDSEDHKETPVTPKKDEQLAKMDVTDELQQLDIDLAFLDHVQSQDYDNLERFMSSLACYHPDGSDAFSSEIEGVINLICRGDHFQYFFTDRDGTLKSYSCSYQSSIQGAYSGVIQATFAQRCAQYAAIVTSAPLSNIGITDVLCMPDNYYCYGASAGREWYVNSSKKFKDNSISDADLELLDRVGDRIQALLEKPKYQRFAWIGSGFQKHYGHITVAKRDIYGMVDEKKSQAWYSVICDLAHELDPSARTLHVQDTDTDIKVFLKAKLSGRVFTKGHGIRLFAERMGLDLTDGNILIFGDSETDLPMLQEALCVNPENTYSVFVTRNEELRQRVTRLCQQCKNQNFAFVSSPEVVLGAMAQATVREIKIRPHAVARQDSE